MPYSEALYYFDSNPKALDEHAVVLLHGAAGTHLHWPHQLRRLNEHRVLAPDLPGHGKSEGLGEQRVENYAEGIAEWLELIGIAQAVLVGHSMGGAIAQTLALSHPDLVSRLVLVSTGAVLPVNPQLLEKAAIPAAAPGVYDQIVKWAYHPSTNPKLVQQARKQMDGVRHTVTHGDFEACNKFNNTELLAQITAPTLVICGDTDKMTPLRLSKQLAESIPNARLEILPEAGHMLSVEQPEKLAELISDFIDPE